MLLHLGQLLHLGLQQKHLTWLYGERLSFVFHLLCFNKLTIMAFHVKTFLFATSIFKFFNLTCRYILSNFFFFV